MPKYVVQTQIKGVDVEVGKQVEMTEKDATPLLACGALGDPVTIKEAMDALATPVKSAAETLVGAAEKQVNDELLAEKDQQIETLTTERDTLKSDLDRTTSELEALKKANAAQVADAKTPAKTDDKKVTPIKKDGAK